MFKVFYHLFTLLRCLHHRIVISSIRGLFISQTSLVFIEFSRFTNDQETLALSQFEIQIHFSPKLIIKPKIINKETNCLRIVFLGAIRCGMRFQVGKPPKRHKSRGACRIFTASHYQLKFALFYCCCCCNLCCCC